MDAISYTAARQNLAKVMEQVCGDRAPLLITRQGQPSVVMLSLDEYEALQETAHLLRSPANVQRLFASIQELESGGGNERELLEE